MSSYYRKNYNDTNRNHINYREYAVSYFEIDDGGNVLRQVNCFTSGLRIKYDQAFSSNDFGVLSNNPINLTEDYIPITQNEFEGLWTPNGFYIAQTDSCHRKPTTNVSYDHYIYLPLSDELYQAFNDTQLRYELVLPVLFTALEELDNITITTRGLNDVISLFKRFSPAFNKELQTELKVMIRFIQMIKKQKQEITIIFFQTDDQDVE